MPTRIWKDSLLSGTWVTPKGQVFHCGPKDLTHFDQRLKDMIAKGSPIPWVWEHQRVEGDDVNLSANDVLAQWAQNTGGHIHDSRIRGDKLELLIDVSDGDRDKLNRIKFVSPEIRHNWRDRNGPASDGQGVPYWPGQSIAHLAVTPMPVQYPQSPFQLSSSASKPISLSQAAVTVSLSSAQLVVSLAASSGEKKMPMPPSAKKSKAAPPPELDDDEDSLGGEPEGDDLPEETPDAGPDVGGEGGNDDASLIQALTAEASELGIELHSDGKMTLKDAVAHFITALKTHKATKAGGDTPGDGETPPDGAMEPETSEQPPIMMSQANQPTAREKKLAEKLLKQSTAGLADRVGTLHARGYIDETIRRELANKIGTVKLSMSDITEDGDIRPFSVAIEIAAYERLMKVGKPAFAKPNSKPAPGRPISLSRSASEEVVDPPYGDDERTSRANQEEAGDELAALAGARPTKR